jgi:hypothetical protein
MWTTSSTINSKNGQACRWKSMTMRQTTTKNSPIVSVAEAYRMVEKLERFWMQQDDSGIPFIAASQKMKDSVNMIRTKQLVQRNIDSFFQRI